MTKAMTKNTHHTVAIDCTKCQHYYITWDPDRPYGCRHFAFKSPHTPALAVIESSQDRCLAFQAKQNTVAAETSAQVNKGGWIA
jgi:hypothetical protein